MKPDWKDAPEWANYLALDSDGYYWFEFQPVIYEGVFKWSEGRYTHADFVCQTLSIEFRPLDTK